MPHDVFVSYSYEDKTKAELLVAGLEKMGIDCWIASRDITKTTSIAEQIISAIKNSRLMVVVLSHHSNESKQVTREVELAVVNDIILIPFRVEDMEPFGALSYFLSSTHWVDAYPQPLEGHISKLGSIAQEILKEPSAQTDTEGSLQAPSSKENTSSGKGIGGFFGLRKKNRKQTTPSVQKSPDENQAEQLQIIDSFEVICGNSHGTIRLCVGDPTSSLPEGNADLLVVWSRKDDYAPITGSLINTLKQRGISIEALSKDKEADLRQEAFSCWLSREINGKELNFPYKRILCYEPEESTKAAENVGDIFRSLAPFLGEGLQIHSASTPLLASGQLMKNKRVMLTQLVEAAAHWMASGLPLECFNIFCSPDSRNEELVQIFSELKTNYSSLTLQKQDKLSYDLFISYSHQDSREVNLFLDHLLTQKQDMRIFFDKKSLNPGSAWQSEIYEAIDDCYKVATFFSPTYLDSKVCLEEFNIALCRQRESEDAILKPIYLYSANLPTYMRMIQYFDCRESNRDKLRQAATHLLQSYSD